MFDNYMYADLEPICDDTEESRIEDCTVMLTVEENVLLDKLADEMNLSRGEVVGRALRVLQKCREFIGE